MFKEKLEKKGLEVELFVDKYDKSYDIGILEKKYKITYPDDYKEFIKETNGLFLCGYAFVLDFEGKDGGFSIETFFGCFDENEIYDIEYEMFLRYKRYPMNYMPIADNGGNTHLISLNKKDYGYIYSWDHELEYGLFEGQDEEDGALRYFGNMTLIAKSFTEFIEKIEPYNHIDTEDKKEEQKRINEYPLSPLLKKIIKKSGYKDIDFENKFREIARKIVKEKGRFSLHQDETSYLMYDLQFMLYTNSFNLKSLEEYLDKYSDIIALPGAKLFSMKAWWRDFVIDWYEKRKEEGRIKENKKMFSKNIKFTQEYEKDILSLLENI